MWLTAPYEAYSCIPYEKAINFLFHLCGNGNTYAEHGAFGR